MSNKLPRLISSKHARNNAKTHDRIEISNHLFVFKSDIRRYIKEICEKSH